jgi:proline-rich protein PRCC
MCGRSNSHRNELGEERLVTREISRASGVAMGLLGLDYGSGSDDSDDDANDGTRERIVLAEPEPTAATAAVADEEEEEEEEEEAPLDFSSILPPPRLAESSRGVIAGLPNPTAKKTGKKKKVIAFKPPVKTSALTSGADSDSEEEAKRAEKRRKTRAAGRGGGGIASFLPKPKNMDVLGGGGDGLGGGLGGGGGTALDLGGGDGRGGGGIEAAAAAAEEEAPAIHPSQLYAVDESGRYLHASHHAAAYASGVAGPARGGIEERARAIGGMGAGGAGGFSVDAALDDALEIERRRAEASGRGGPGVTVKTVDLDTVRSNSRHLLDDKTSATGLAFDDAYREKLQKEAGAKPSFVHKSKNQIGSLLYNAKQNELKILEGRLQGVTHKAMAKQKYGW